MQVDFEASGVTGRSRPSLAALAVGAVAPRAHSASRTAAGLAAVVVPAPSAAVHPDLALRTTARPQAGGFELSAQSAGRSASRMHGVSLLRLRPLAISSHNRSVETDTQRQGVARRRGRSYAPRRLAAGCGSPSRYTDANHSVPLASTGGTRALRLSCRAGAVGVQAACAVLRPGTIAGFGQAPDRRPSLPPRPVRSAMTHPATSGARECRPSQALRGSVGSKWSNAPRGLQTGPLYNKAVDTDVLSAGCRRPTVRRSLLR